MRLLTTAALTLSLLCIPALVQSVHAAPPQPPEEAPLLEWTLSAARQRAVEHNVGLLIARMQRQVNQLVAQTARAPFVPIVSARSFWRDETSLQIQGERNRSLSYQTSLRWNLPFGTRLTGSAGATEFFSGASFVPTPTTSLTFGVVQPLLRDGWGRGNTLEAADLEVEAQRAIFIEQLNTFLVEVDRAYWQLALAQADVKIKIRSRDRARRQYEDTKANIERGLLAPGEIYVVEDNLVFFKQNLARSREALALAQTQFARLLRVNPRAALVATAELSPAVVDAAEELVRFERAVDTALSNNPNVVARQVAVAQAEVRRTFQRNQYLPSLDLDASTSFNGIDERRGAAWAGALSADNPDLRAGVVFEIPLVRRPDRAEVEQAELEVKRRELALREARDDVRYGMRELRVQLRQRAKVARLADDLVRLARLKLENEQQKYQSGLSTLFNVVQFQREFDSARIAAQRARVDVLILQSRLWRLQGTLYQRADLTVR